MIRLTNKSECSGCSACVGVCPKQCIKMQADEEGFLYPKVEENACIHCGLCEKICPVLHKKKDVSQNVTAYAGYNKDENIRMQSSSGGLFTLFASAIIARGGVVFGAGFNEALDVVHSYVETIEDLAKFRGSKYVQSKIGDTYKQAENFLKQGRWVLFTGTPCQIGGLYAYLKKDYDTLFTQDIICHGVPSPLVWKSYLKHKAKGKQIQSFTFRDKVDGWSQYRYTLTYADGGKDSVFAREDALSAMFLRNLSLRPSCYQCAFKGKNRQSDITLADYWGINAVHPEMNDDKGTSLLLVHTDKGQTFFKEIQESIAYLQTDVDMALTHNPSALTSSPLPINRKTFIKDAKKMSFDKLEKKYCKGPSLFRQYLSIIKRKLLGR